MLFIPSNDFMLRGVIHMAAYKDSVLSEHSRCTAKFNHASALNRWCWKLGDYFQVVRWRGLVVPNLVLCLKRQLESELPVIWRSR